ncbi:terminase small subunit [Agrobacterium sp. S2/73]|uniref:terminase small subunit n=1 Tax=unclassified Agrobacterium TaxID=2632611 RepID=UPI001ADAE667|nr:MULTISPECIES: terminase small subunit [unclassified Agrobacterium]MBO9108747.1 terminase small subunit [Agrobacterium sp. S2/73]QXZ73495.1 terminase small subunit [Agrobacterium sp. S7/73]
MALTSKQEAFARAYVETGNASEAYRTAYQVSSTIKPETVHKRASELLANGEVTGRVSELQGNAAKRCAVTLESLASELEEARAIAITEKQPSAAVSATMGKAKLFGLGSENRKISGTIQVVTISAKQLDALTEDELALLETAYPVLQKLGLIGGDTVAAAEEGSAE